MASSANDSLSRVLAPTRCCPRVSLIALVSLSALVAGCGSPLVGTYHSEISFIEGMTESSEPGYSLEDFESKRPRDNPSLTLNRKGRFVWNTGSVINEGTWWVEGDTLFLREDIYNGVTIGPLLRKNREWRIGDNGEIIRTGAYNLYHMQEVYVPE